MSFKSATLFTTAEPLSPKVEAFELWGAPGKNQASTIGLVPQFHPQPLGNSGQWFKVRISERKPVKSDLKLRIAALPSELTKDERLAQIEEITLEALQATRPTHKTVDVVVYNEWLIVFESSENTVDAVTSWIRTQCEEQLGMKLYKPDDADFTVMVRELMKGDDTALEDLAVGNKFEIVDDHGKDNKRTIKVTATHNDHGGDLIAFGFVAQEVRQCSILWQDFSAVFSGDWVLRGITCSFADVDYDDAENDLQRATTEAWYIARQLPQFVKRVADAASEVL